MSDFVPVAKTSEIPDPGKLLVEVDDRLVVVIHAAGRWYALDDVCTHDGGPLSEGPLDPAADTLACPRHGAKFDIKNGAALTMPAMSCLHLLRKGKSLLGGKLRRAISAASSQIYRHKS